MIVRFYNGRRRVGSISANSTARAIELFDSWHIEWTRYKVFAD